MQVLLAGFIVGELAPRGRVPVEARGRGRSQPGVMAVCTNEGSRGMHLGDLPQPTPAPAVRPTGTLFVQLSPDLDHGSQFLGVCFMSVGMLAFISLPLTGTRRPRTWLTPQRLRLCASCLPAAGARRWQHPPLTPAPPPLLRRHRVHAQAHLPQAALAALLPALCLWRRAAAAGSTGHRHLHRSLCRWGRLGCPRQPGSVQAAARALLAANRSPSPAAPARAVLVYFTAGFTYAAAPFFVYCLTLLAAGLVFGGLFIALAAVTPTLQITGGLAGTGGAAGAGGGRRAAGGQPAAGAAGSGCRHGNCPTLRFLVAPAAGVVLLMLLLMSGFCIIEPKIPGGRQRSSCGRGGCAGSHCLPAHRCSSLLAPPPSKPIPLQAGGSGSTGRTP